MTIGEFNALWREKAKEKNPLRLPALPAAVHAIEDLIVVTGEELEQFRAWCDYHVTLLSAISEVFGAISEELNLSIPEVEKLPSEALLPPRASALAEKLRSFPGELCEGR